MGVEGAGEGGKSFPEMSSFENAAPSTFLSVGDIAGRYLGKMVPEYHKEKLESFVFREL